MFAPLPSLDDQPKLGVGAGWAGVRETPIQRPWFLGLTSRPGLRANAPRPAYDRGHVPRSVANRQGQPGDGDCGQEEAFMAYQATRRMTSDECRKLFDAADGRCGSCRGLLGDAWPTAHLPLMSIGSPSSHGVEPWCIGCAAAVGAVSAISIPGFTLREWQAEALEIAMACIWRRGSATIHAAPGAGKTSFTGRLPADEGSRMGGAPSRCCSKLRSTGAVARVIVRDERPPRR